MSGDDSKSAVLSLIRLFKGFWVLCLAFLLVACAEMPKAGDPEPPVILAMGDSMLAWNGSGGNAVSDEVERRLEREVIDRSLSGASMLYALPLSGSFGLRISRQYIKGDWDWVILNGGGNDLWLGCGCKKCERMMDRMVSEDGSSGEIPELVRKVREAQARVIYLGYLRTPGKDSPIDHCRDVGDQFEARIAKMAEQDKGVFFVSNKDLVPHGDLSYHSADRIHPSVKGSAAIGARVARLIQRHGE